jgi:hypothetical protein
MPRPVALFTGQRADLPRAVLAREAKGVGRRPLCIGRRPLWFGRGPLCVGWEDPLVDRGQGAREAARFVRAPDYPGSAVACDASFGAPRGR